MCRGVIFDLDGLLADTEPIWNESARRLLSRRGLAWDPALKPRFMGRPPLVVAGMLVEHYGMKETPEELLAERMVLIRTLYDEAPIQPMPGARSLVRALHADGLPLAVASGSPTNIARKVLDGLGLTQCLVAIIGSDQVNHGKPAPDIFLLAAQKISRAPEHCFVLEDAALGVEAALAAGMTCICVPSPETPADAADKAHRVVSSLEELGVEDF
jgi:HAD superfamily hydrolase (TIGR01509 family)